MVPEGAMTEPVLVLEITERVAAGYPVRLLEDGAVLATGTIPELLPLVRERPFAQLAREIVVDEYRPPPDVVAAVSSALFGLLSDGGVGPAWQAARSRSQGTTTLLDVRGELAQLPWELTTVDGRRPALDGGLTRVHLPLDQPAGAEPSPLRVLVVVGDTDPKLNADAEVAAIQRALAPRAWRAHSEVLIEPSSGDFYDRVADLKPHILHFIGHGGLANDSETPVLKLVSSATREPWDISADKIRTGLLGWIPSLLVLNACRSGDLSAQAGVWSVAEAAIDAGMSAVLCMQGLVDSEIAVLFSGVFYGALNAGEPIDAAVTKARMRIAQQGDLRRRDWALPALHLRVPVAGILPVSCALTHEEIERLGQIPEFTEVPRLVDRDLQRRQMWGTFDPTATDGGSPHGLVAVTGQVDAGRTRLVYSSLLTCASRGHAVRYLDFFGTRRMSWIKVLYAIRDGLAVGGSGLRAALPADAFAVFNREIGALAEGRAPRDGEPVPEQPPCPEFAAGTEHAPEYTRRIFARFIEALRTAAADKPLTLALDHLVGVGGVIGDELTTVLSPYLLGPAARGELLPVRLIVVLGDEEVSLLAPEVRATVHEVKVPGIEQRLYPFLQREHYARAGHDDAMWSRFLPVVTAYQDLVGENWYPHWFGDFDRVVRRSLRR
jgi:hypothetical protein